MGNMSYCRFQNTLSDLEDCFYTLDDIGGNLEELSKQEKVAAQELISTCLRIVEAYGGENLCD